MLHFQWNVMWAARDGEWKLIGNDKSGSRSLHRLTDPAPEVTDYAAEKPEIVARLEKLHEEWADEVSPK